MTQDPKALIQDFMDWANTLAEVGCMTDDQWIALDKLHARGYQILPYPYSPEEAAQ